MSPRRVFLVDDHPLVRRGLRELLSTEAGMQICGEAKTMDEAMDLFDGDGCDLAIVDLSLEEGDGLELVRRLGQCWPGVPVLVYSMHDPTLYAERVFAAGARGYLEKREAPDEVLKAVRRVLDGERYLSSEMTLRLEKHGGTFPEEHPAQRLSDRELQVFNLLGRGHGTRKIAERLNLSHKTIESHRENIKKKLGLRNHNELVRRAVHWVLESR